VAFVAGASRGIGRNIACALAREGAAVAIAARSATPAKLPGTIYTVGESIEEEGGRAFPVVCDVTDEASVETAVSATVSELGGIDILVANAGVMWLAPTLATPLNRWELCLRVNLTGVFLVTKAVLPYVLARGCGSLIAVTTNGVAMTHLGSNAYWISKAGVERYYLGLAEELQDQNVAVNCLAPKKVVLTEGWQAGGAGIELAPDMIEEPEAMGQAAVILATQDATGITGSIQYSLDLIEKIGGAMSTRQ
jgi:NAD(P)-dependent dehydrogenase (short-subunit alcohol dehydrogenase family)